VAHVVEGEAGGGKGGGALPCSTAADVRQLPGDIGRCPSASPVAAVQAPVLPSLSVLSLMPPLT